MCHLCQYLGVTRQAYYKWIQNGKPMHKCFDEYLAGLIEDIFHEIPKGHRYIKDQLKRRFGLIYNDKTILRYMHILHLECPIRKKKYVCCTKQEANEKARIVCNNVLARNF